MEMPSFFGCGGFGVDARLDVSQLYGAIFRENIELLGESANRQNVPEARKSWFNLNCFLGFLSLETNE
jgi:hypothetical protein